MTTVDCIRRFTISSNATSAPLTRRSVAASIGAYVIVANTNASCLASSFRLRSITVWPAAGSSVIIDVPSISSGAEQALSKESTKNAILPTGITVDEPVVWRPARGTYLSMWQNTGDNPTDQFLAISGATGAVLDVHYQYTQAGSVSTPPQALTTSTAAVGYFGCFSLDTGNKITVVGYNPLAW